MKLTSNRRRWMHTFPVGELVPTGIYLQRSGILNGFKVLAAFFRHPWSHFWGCDDAVNPPRPPPYSCQTCNS